MTLPKPFRASDVKTRANFIDIVSNYSLLRRVGRQYVGLCPFHSERHPSFYVHPEKKVFYCFGCGVGGDVFSFVMRICQCDFRRALEIVSESSDGVARTSDPRSGSRFGASEGAKPLSLPKAGIQHSQSCQDSRVRILANLDATNRQLRAIDATNRLASQALATDCEPERSDGCFIYQQPDNCPETDN